MICLFKHTVRKGANLNKFEVYKDLGPGKRGILRLSMIVWHLALIYESEKVGETIKQANYSENRNWVLLSYNLLVFAKEEVKWYRE